MWNWTLRAYLMTLIPVTLEQVVFIGESERRDGVVKMPKPTWTL